MLKYLKHTSIIIFLFLNILCNGQKTISLVEAYNYSRTDDGIPEDVTYVKDLNNSLNQFIGTWKGSYDGKDYEIKFEKVLNYGNYDIFWDKLFGKILVKSLNGENLFNSLNKNIESPDILYGINIQRNTYMLSFVGNAKCNDQGVVYIEITKNNPNKMTLYFDRDKSILFNIDQTCPNYSTYKTLLPTEKITLTRQ